MLYIKHWLTAPVAMSDGTVEARDRGMPQGKVISPLLANLYLHYAFDLWMDRTFPTLKFERYADDVICHCHSERQARYLKERLARRRADCRLRLHPEKTKIAYCADSNRRQAYPVMSFDFMGYTYRPRKSQNRQGVYFTNSLPTVSSKAAKAIRAETRSWRLHERSHQCLGDLARMINARVRGWLQYYGAFYRSAMYALLRKIDECLIRWAMRKFKRLRRRKRRAACWLAGVARRQPDLFTHWLVLRSGFMGRVV